MQSITIQLICIKLLFYVLFLLPSSSSVQNSNSYRSSDDENSNSANEINSSDHCDDDFDIQLRKPKYLQCPAIFTISNLKKFLLNKFSINASKFCVEIMYKVKTIALPDYYTLMDVAYIYTWKRVRKSIY